MKFTITLISTGGLLLTTARGCSAFSPSSTQQLSSKTALFNIPPPSVDDIEGFKAYADRQNAPASFFELQSDCLRSAQLAIRDGFDLLEIEFPPLPANVLDLDDVSAYDVAQANLKLALDLARGFTKTSEKEQKITILFPDESEAKIGVESLTGQEDVGVVTDIEPGICISSLRRSEEGDDRNFKPEQTFLNLFGGGGKSGDVKPLNGTDVYIVLVASAQELPDIEELHEQVKDDKIPIIMYNLKLDVLRGDLGAPAFPPKEFQDRFLSKVKPVYYLRTRQYSRSTTKPPFLVNYQGCLFRAYPGQFQTLLDTGTGSYRRLLGSDIRPGLGAFKEQLTQALRDDGILPADEGSALNFLRTGYKTTTWWEEERKDASMDWMT
ncbi:unnamed protein product [Cylindrotheca closterium]|uniref:DUF1995 domain-containing protein n=1 Tax=Cylindrotheca closterium TaxID=2856 RepID=A0AAD2CJK4_9STRA|nr:unnamed protein product [Cylindrotheca closterium]